MSPSIPPIRYKEFSGRIAYTADGKFRKPSSIALGPEGALGRFALAILEQSNQTQERCLEDAMPAGV